jgi:hypothetical protein
VRFAVTLLAALSLAAPALAAPPGAGVLVPGRSLGGLALGQTKAAVEQRWGRAYGVCRGCERETWYFNYYAFQPRGAGIELRNGRVSGIFTLYQPLGWRTTREVALADPVTRVTSVYGALLRHDCVGYYALTMRQGGTTTAFYVLGDRLWAFGLFAAGVPLCR